MKYTKIGNKKKKNGHPENPKENNKKKKNRKSAKTYLKSITCAGVWL